MTTRYDLIAPRASRDGKTFWNKVGVAFPRKDGEGFQLILEAYPLPDKEGRVVMLMSPPRERDAAPSQDYARARETPAGGAPRHDLGGDDIPFAPEMR